MHKGGSAKITHPITKSRIRSAARQFRRALLRNGEKSFPIMTLLETLIPASGIDPELYIHPVPAEELPGKLAETIPSQHLIQVREDIYLAAHAGEGFARYVMAHELWHYLMHDTSTISFAYVDDSSRVPDSMDPEKQADVFAAELLAPSQEVRGMKIQQISSLYGVTKRTAAMQKQVGEHAAMHRKSTKQITSKKQNNSRIKKKRSGRQPNRRRRK